MIKFPGAQILLMLLSMQVILISQASAHPGPAGHTHPDEWPFEILAYLVLGVGVAWVCRFMWKRN